jgi:ankyrin repeat protein
MVDDPAKDLVDAVRYRKVDSVRLLLDAGVNVNSSARSSTPLVSAARAGDETILRLLIDAGADLNLRKPGSGDFPLLAAAKTGNWNAFHTLLDAGAAPDLCNGQGQTPLMAAVGKDGPEVVKAVKALVAKGANVNGSCLGGDTVLHLACVPLIPLLLELGADPARKNADGHTALAVARTNGNVAAVRLLTDAMAKLAPSPAPKAHAAPAKPASRAPADPPPARPSPPPGQRLDQRPETADKLVKSASQGNVEQVRKLLMAGADPDLCIRNSSPLCVAAFSGMADVVQALLDGGASVNLRLPTGVSALDCAIRNQHIDCVKVILAAGAASDGSVDGRPTPLMRAASIGLTPAVTLLIDAKADVNAALPNGTTALMMAAQQSSPSTTRILLEAGADPTPANMAGQTALAIAKALKKSDEIIRLLEEAEAKDGGGSQDIVEVLPPKRDVPQSAPPPSPMQPSQESQESVPDAVPTPEKALKRAGPTTDVRRRKRARVRPPAGIISEQLSGKAYFRPDMSRADAERAVRDGRLLFVVRFSAKTNQFILTFKDGTALQRWVVSERPNGWLTVGPVHCATITEGLKALNLPDGHPPDAVHALQVAGAPVRMLDEVAARLATDDAFATWYRGAADLVGHMGDEFIRVVTKKMYAK